MARAYGVRLRTALLGAAGSAALAAGTRPRLEPRAGFLLVAAGGFALGLAAGRVLAGARAAGRAEGSEGARRAAPEGRARLVQLEGRAGDPEPAAAAAGRASPATVARAAVAAVAHDMSNPLAALRSNLEWLRDALETGRLDAPEEQAEAREVLRDAREAAERLRAEVGALREAGRGDGPEAGPAAPRS